MPPPNDTYRLAGEPPGDRPDPTTAEGRKQLVALQLLTHSNEVLAQRVMENTRVHLLGTTRREPTGSGPDPAAGGGPIPVAPDAPGGGAGRPGVAAAVAAILKAAAAKGAGRPGRGSLRNARRRMSRVLRSKRSRKFLRDLGRGKAGPTPKFTKQPGSGNAAKGLAALGPAIGRLLGPLGVLASILGNSASGFGMLNKALQLATAVFAPIFLPNILLLSAAVLALSDVFMQELFPILQKWFPFVLMNGVKILQHFIDAVSWVASQLVKIVNGLIGAINWVIAQLNKAGAGIAPIAAVAPPAGPDQKETAQQDAKDQADRKAVQDADREMERRLEVERKRIQGLNEKRKQEGKPLLPDDQIEQFMRKERDRLKELRDADLKEKGIDPMKADMIRRGQTGRSFTAIGGNAGDVRETLKDVAKTLRMSVGPKASIGALDSPRSAAMLAYLNVDPIEARQLNALLKTLDTVDQILGHMERQQGPMAK